jgi:hypothetical protein
MSDIPWWAHSPSPMTLTIYSLLAFYGAYKLESNTWRQWLHNFCESAFVIGLIILPYDTGWQTFQWLKFGFLYANEMKVVYGTYIRNLALYSLCLLSSWKLMIKTNKLELKKSALFLYPTAILLITFLLSPDPGFTDWTYAMRWPNLSSAYWLFSYLSDVPIRIMTALAYVALWKDNFVGRNRYSSLK